jgi:uncharacterized protein (DUF433 family)
MQPHYISALRHRAGGRARFLVVLFGAGCLVSDAIPVGDYQDRIIPDPGICGGEPVFRGTRVTLRTVLASLAEGHAVEGILTDFPTLTAADVNAAICFAAASGQEDLPVPAVPQMR